MARPRRGLQAGSTLMLVPSVGSHSAPVSRAPTHSASQTRGTDMASPSVTWGPTRPAGRPASGSSAAVAARGPVRRAAHATRTPRYISHDGIYDPNRRPAGHRHRGLHSEWLSLAPVDAAWPSAWLDAAAPRPRRTRLQMRRPGRGGRGITRCRAVTFFLFRFLLSPRSLPLRAR